MNPYFQQFQNPYGMYGFQQPAPMVKPVQPLSQEEINHLRTQVNELTNVALTPDEILKAKCTHKYKDGRYSLIPLNPDDRDCGDVVCEICGSQFNLNPIDDSTLTSAIAIVKNSMQQVKTLWPDIPMAVATEYMMTEPLLGKLPGLYKVANDHNTKYMNSINFAPQQMAYTNGGFGTGNAFDVFNCYTNMYPYAQPPMGPQMYAQQPMGQPMYTQPNMGPQMYAQQPMGQPMYAQQPPMGQPMYGQQPMVQQMYTQQPPMQMGGMGMGGNPFGYESTQQPAPAVPVQANAPQAAAPAAAPATGTVEVKKQFSL